MGYFALLASGFVLNIFIVHQVVTLICSSHSTKAGGFDTCVVNREAMGGGGKYIRSILYFTRLMNRHLNSGR